MATSWNQKLVKALHAKKGSLRSLPDQAQCQSLHRMEGMRLATGRPIWMGEGFGQTVRHTPPNLEPPLQCYVSDSPQDPGYAREVLQHSVSKTTRPTLNHDWIASGEWSNLSESRFFILTHRCWWWHNFLHRAVVMRIKYTIITSKAGRTIPGKGWRLHVSYHCDPEARARQWGTLGTEFQ